MQARLTPLIDVNDRTVYRYFIYRNGRLVTHENGAALQFKTSAQAQACCRELSDPDLLDPKGRYHFTRRAI